MHAIPRLEPASSILTSLSEGQRFQILVDGVVDYALYLLDPLGFVVSWNSGAKKLKGYEPVEIIGQHFSRFFTPEDVIRGVPAKILAEAEATGRVESEAWRVRKDGSRFMANAVLEALRDDSGQLIGFAKITRDITERVAAQNALLESERKFRMLIRGVVDYAIYMLDPQGIVTNWNAGAQRIKGYTEAEIVGQHFSKFYTDQDRASGLPARVLEIAAKAGRYEAEGLRVRKDGTTFWANVVIDPVYDEHGVLVGYAKVTRDISERRDAQAELNRMQGQRAQSQKMEAIGQLTGGIAHDFNNLLMIVTSHLRTLGKLINDDPKGQRAVKAIETAAARGAALTRQMLTFSRRQFLNADVVDLAQCLDGLLPMLSSSLGARTKLETDLPSDLWLVKTDTNELELALINLAVNARDAMPSGGTLTIGARNVTLRGGDISLGLTGDFLALSVTDTGSGIPEDIQAKIFEPYFTTKREAKGTGLGLAQVHGFVHQAGGTVQVDSKLGAGTKITLYLPRSHESVKAIETVVHPQAAQGMAVLMVEDNPDVAEATKALLAELGHEIYPAGDAEEALEVMTRHRIDFVLSDIVMAGAMDGLALAREIRGRHPAMPILLVTGYSEALTQAESEFAVLRKPFQIRELSQATTKLLSERRL